MISIIIPTFEEEGHIGRLIHYLKTEAAQFQQETAQSHLKAIQLQPGEGQPRPEATLPHPGTGIFRPETGKPHPEILEILVVDGNSRDRTAEEAERAGAHVIVTSKKGRAFQMNEGARRSKGQVLYFLHADTFPPPTFAEDIRRAISRNEPAGGFRLSFDDPHFMLRFYGWFTRFDINAFRYGDQSLFITKELFEQVGGFDESLMVMEDNEIIGRIKRHAGYSIIPKNVITSARKYRENGIIRLQLTFSLIYLLFHFGAEQERLVRVYKRLITGG